MRKSDGRTAPPSPHGGAEGASCDCGATPCVPTHLTDALDACGSDANDPDTPGASEVTAIVLAGGASRRFGGPDDDKLTARLGARSVLDVTLANVPRAWPIVAVGPEHPEHASSDDQDPTTVQGSRPADERHHHEPHHDETDGASSSPHAIARAQDGARFGGPAASPPHVITWVQDDPPFGGPVAAIAAGLPHTTTPLCAILAGDTPCGGIALPALTQASADHDGALLMADDRAQPLIAVYRTASLRAAIAQICRTSGASMRALLAPLDLATVDLARLVTHLDPEDATQAVAHDIDTVDDLAWFHDHGLA